MTEKVTSYKERFTYKWDANVFKCIILMHMHKMGKSALNYINNVAAEEQMLKVDVTRRLDIISRR